MIDIIKAKKNRTIRCWWHTDMVGTGKMEWYQCKYRGKRIASFIIFNLDDVNKKVVTVKIFMNTRLHGSKCLYEIINYIENVLNKHALIGVQQNNLLVNYILLKCTVTEKRVTLSDFFRRGNTSAHLYIYESIFGAS
ncbi:hypothetical protein HU830_01545 [Lactobacillus sp. DCY120]|uniref:Uncharacterized protein n=1 Tax=Bombilactobacillus apium TaxID=2675299 RepID=A0A850R5R9_9LACO|nr:hypothetical protein [Bombilactobacillus apium]NVY95885.1 hypothetical protein [Bombilactobacillus apium]